MCGMFAGQQYGRLEEEKCSPLMTLHRKIQRHRLHVYCTELIGHVRVIDVSSEYIGSKNYMRVRRRPMTNDIDIPWILSYVLAC
jgi:hypothetical protein